MIPALLLLSSLSLAADAGVFEITARPVALEPRIHPAKPGSLRILTVEERVGCARQKELVRVPVFFHEGECSDVNALALVAAVGGQKPIPFQADDIRRDADGRISRVHLYFLIDLAPWQRQQFHLVRGSNPGAKLPPLATTTDGDRVTLAGADLSVTFNSKGALAGSIAGIESTYGKVSAGAGVLGPRVTLVRQTEDLKIIRSSPLSYDDPASQEVRSVRWSSGPLFAKLVVVTGPPKTPDRAEFTYLVPGHGSVLVQSESLYPAESEATQTVGAAADHVLLGDNLKLGEGAQTVVNVPAGLRKLTRSVQGHFTPAFVNAREKLSLLPIPYVQTGESGARLDANGNAAVYGPKNLRRNAGSNSTTLKSFWCEMRYVLSNAVTEEELWETSRRHFQPLVAVVDEPCLTVGDIHAAMPELAKRFFEIKNWGRGWPQTSAMYYLSGNDAMLAKTLSKVPSEKEMTEEFYLPGWLIRGEAPPAPVPGKKKDVGRLDPYHISYAAGSVVPLALYLQPSEKLDAVALAMGRFSRRVNGGKEQFGFPYIDCFATAFNMQIGSYMMGIYGGKKKNDLDLVQFYRDCARTPSIQGIYGHGQRPYPGNIHGPGPSDLLYESTSDFQLRILELYCQENLELHPMVHGRYFDCVDVNADLFHRDTGKRRSWRRANFWRGQSHDHRWEAWDCAPYMGVFAHARDAGRIGSTEAVYFLRYVGEEHINWSELMWFFHADVLLKYSLASYQPAPLPALPTDLQVTSGKAGNVLTWQPVKGAAGYRIYRAERMGGPWVYVNSPYTAKPAALVTATTYTDKDGEPGQAYFVTAQDAERRESRWFADEPYHNGKALR